MSSGAKILVALIPAFVLGACSSGGEPVPFPAASYETPAPWDPDGGDTYAPGVTPDRLQTTITNPFFPAVPGARWVYEGLSDEGLERIEITIDEETRDVWGVAATVQRDTVYVEGELVEDTWDWFAEDDAGNVWYLGEETYEYEHGEVVCDCGAWEAGVDSAMPGIQMLAEPRVGLVYRQEYLAGEAEDLAEIVALDVTVTVAAGTFTGCVRTRDLSALERDVEEFKTHCPGVGTVLEEKPADGERVELIEYSVPAR